MEAMSKDPEKQPHDSASEFSFSVQSTADDSHSLQGLLEKSEQINAAQGQQQPQSSGLVAAWRRFLPPSEYAKKLQEAAAAKKRSEEIDKYLDEEASKTKEQKRIMLYSSQGLHYVLWNQARLSQQPLSESEKESVRHDARRLALRGASHCLSFLWLRIGDKRAKESATAKDDGAQNADIHVPNDSEDPEIARALIAAFDNPEFRAELQRRDISIEEASREAWTDQVQSFATCSQGHEMDPVAHLRRVFAEDYEPTIHDWLHFDAMPCSCRLHRRGPTVNEVDIDRGSHELKFVQFSQMRHRNHWRIFMARALNYGAIVYVADLGVGAMFLCSPEDSWLEMSILQCDSICRSRKYFLNTPIVVLLANVRMFLERLRTAEDQRRFCSVFPDYKGEGSASALEYIRQRFVKAAGDRQDFYIEECEVADSSSVEKVSRILDEKVFKVAAKTESPGFPSSETA
jgi:hypothetical protein